MLAQAIKQLYPNAMFGVGPAIEEGFYYDIDLGDIKLTEDDLPKIEKKMQALVASGETINRIVVSKEEALELFKNDIYKKELIEEGKKRKILSPMEIDLLNIAASIDTPRPRIASPKQAKLIWKIREKLENAGVLV